MNTDFSRVLRSRIVWISALGYFVDLYDLVLFGVVRIASLKSLGIPDADLLSAGARLLNLQMAGMLVGGFVWGVLGDRFGRMRVLYGSIFLYSTANLLNAFVPDLTSYGVLRFIAGFGLAGELGAAVTLVSEGVPKSARGIGSVVIGLAGFLGASCAATLGGRVSWQMSYLIGGLLGISLLFLRVKAGESTLFLHARGSSSTGSPLKTLLKSPTAVWRYLRCILVGMPIWFVAGILNYFAPEFGQALNIPEPVTAGNAILWGYVGSIAGDPLSGLLSQMMRSRKKSLQTFALLNGMLLVTFFAFLPGSSANAFYFFSFLLGISNGYWTLFVTLSSELFGTNVRATVTTTIPNIVRAMVIPMTTAFLAFKGQLGTLTAAAMIGAICVIAALVALQSLPETFHKDLDYLES